MADEKEELFEQMQEITGHLPVNARLMVKILSHPDLIKYTLRYFKSLDREGRCLNYQPPWDCAREAEAQYENIKYGWLGGVNGVGYTDQWCKPCRDRVMENG